MRTLLALLLLTIPAGAHDAPPTAGQPEGWSYPLACCSSFDCTAVPADWITEGPNGVTILPTGEVLPYSSYKVKPSPDGQFHLCRQPNNPDAKTICVFLPPRGY